MYALDGGSFGLQLGAESTDVVLLVMNNRGVDALLNSKVKLGANASAAAGPKGRNVGASTDASMRAEILSYSRRAASSPASRSTAPRCARTMTRPSRSTDGSGARAAS